MDTPLSTSIAEPNTTANPDLADFVLSLGAHADISGRWYPITKETHY